MKFALFTLEARPSALRRGTLERTAASDAARQLSACIEAELPQFPLGAIGHRIVHGGPHYRQPQIITPDLIAALRTLMPFAPNHLPDEIALIEAMQQLHGAVPQFACFDTAFHYDLPAVARRLPIPRSYDAEGLRRYGFHGLSYSFLVEELRDIAGPRAAEQHVVLAHLGNGSSLAALSGGRSVDTSMGFTPFGGVVMSTRPGDLDPGVVTYISRTTGLDAVQMEDLLSRRSGLAGISGTSGDMRELLAREDTDEDCRLAVAIYCYEIRKRIGSYAAALGGLDTLAFSGGIGEHAPVVRARICEGLGFLGIDIDHESNDANAPVISRPSARVTVRVIPTDEEAMIARAASDLFR
jgi:acetate kinase